MKRRILVALTCVAAAPAQHPAPKPAVHQAVATAAADSGAAPQALLAAVPAGPLHDAVRRILLKPYADATATSLADPAWDGTAPEKLPSPRPDLVLLADGPLQAACRAGTVAKLDWARLDRDRYFTQAASDCGAGAYLMATALAWDRDKISPPPTWSDFWDVARHPGRRALPHAARGTLEIALLADGVSPRDVYRTLRSADGLDRAFRKLDQLKPYVQWWDQPSQPAQWLASGKVLFTSAPAASIPPAGAASHHHLGVQWSASQAVAMLAIQIAGDAARQAELAQAVFVGPAVRDAVDLLPGATRALVPAGPADLAGALVVDPAFWAESGEKLEQRFAAWLQK
jgi:putative spermidine/putrescine transport system substrate-binding protein